MVNSQVPATIAKAPVRLAHIVLELESAVAPREQPETVHPRSEFCKSIACLSARAHLDSSDAFDVEDASEGQSAPAQDHGPTQGLLSRLAKLEGDLAQERAARERTFQFLLKHRSSDMQLSSSVHDNSLPHNIADQSASNYASQLFSGPTASAHSYTEHTAPAYDAQFYPHDLNLPAVHINCFTVDRKTLPACCRPDLRLTNGHWSADEANNLMAKVQRYFDGLASHCLSPCVMFHQCQD